MQPAYQSECRTQVFLNKSEVLILVLIGCVAYTFMDTWPLYSQNQNTKFLYGLAKAGIGRLEDDWLITQGSQLPIFDAFVYFSAAFVGEWFFYAAHLATVTAFGIALYGIARVVGVTRPDRFGLDGRWFLLVFGIWFVFFGSSHSTLTFFWGFASQYINGHTFQPQNIGVLTLLGLLLFRLGETGWATVLIVSAAWIHPAFAIPGLMSLLGMAIARWTFGSSVNTPPLVLVAGVVGCLSAAGFAYSLLQPTDPAEQAEALRIITEIRIPEHSWPENWINEDLAYRVGGFIIVLWIARRDPLGCVLTTMTAAMLLLTVWVYVTRDHALALAAPWRASTIVIPAGVAILFGRLAQWIADWARAHTWRRIVISLALLTLSARTIDVTLERVRSPWPPGEKPRYYAWVRENAREGDLFLTSIRDEDFRLSTGQPQYVSWKTHPHRPASVLAWYDRIAKASATADAEQVPCNLLEELAADGVTHLVRPTSPNDVRCRGWRVVYEDDYVVIFSRRA